MPTNSSPNHVADGILRGQAEARPEQVAVHQIGGATVLDFGVQSPGSLEAGISLARGCMGGRGEIRIASADAESLAVSNSVWVQTDNPLMGCLGCQYAGWPVQSEDYFAMGSGPMRLRRGREGVLEQLALGDSESSVLAGVLESDRLPTESAVAVISEACSIRADAICLAVAPSTSIAGTVQIVARSIETAMHKLHELGFAVERVTCATGSAPLAPPAKRGDLIAGIGRTNDAMLYGATVTLWVDCEDDSIETVLEKVPSSSSPDFGRPFAKIFADYDHDFYKVDPSLFSPAVVIFHNLKSGKTYQAGKLQPAILRESFGR